jgi:hypothetical protein
VRGCPTAAIFDKNDLVSPLFSIYEIAKNQSLDTLVSPGLCC